MKDACSRAGMAALVRADHGISSGEVYLVGGAVRDHLLGLPVRDRDWLVTGSTPALLEAAGFRQVGHSFPVFLHPVSGEEYALARTERKSGPGYGGFVCDFSPDVTLEEDLQRRDFTINAMAIDAAACLHDPWGGNSDLARRQIRHVSEAFCEDPLRVLRGARFATRLAPLDFKIAAGTLELMRQMCRADRLAELAAERVWQETLRALGCDRPGCFFQILESVDGLHPWFAELAAGGAESFAVLDHAIDLPAAAEDRFVLLLASACKDQEAQTALCRRLRLPDSLTEAVDILRTFAGIATERDLRSAACVLQWLDSSDYWRRPQRSLWMLQLLEALLSYYQSGRPKGAHRLPQTRPKALRADFERWAIQAARLSGSALAAEGWRGAEIRVQLHQRRLSVLEQAIKADTHSPGGLPIEAATPEAGAQLPPEKPF